MSWTSTPASISSAAIRCAPALVFSYMNRPVSVTSATYSAPAISGVSSAPEQLRQLEHDLGRAGGLGIDQVQGPEAGVVVVVVDVQDHGLVPLQEVDGHAVDVSAVEEDHDPVRRRRPAARGRPPRGAGTGTRPAAGTPSPPGTSPSPCRAASRMWCIASSDPSASPSGPSWVVSRKRSPARSSWATSSSDASLRSAAAATASLTASSSLRDADAALRGLVVVEGQGRGSLDPHLAARS